ncbi:MAG: hypothetical protein ABT940_08085 [Alphaproteobacteria bacterium]
MVMERRSIVFSLTEVAQALRGQGAVAGGDIPEVTSEDVLFDAALDKPVMLHLSASGGHTLTMSFSHDQVIKALVHRCNENKVPVPETAKKRLAPHKGQVALLMELGDDRMNVLSVCAKDSVHAILEGLLAGATSPSMRIHRADNSSSALSILQDGDRGQIDLILVFLHKGTNEEIGFVKMLRDDVGNRHSTVPVLALAFHKSECLYGVGKRGGVSAIVSLPVTKSALIGKIRQACGYWNL